MLEGAQFATAQKSLKENAKERNWGREEKRLAIRKGKFD
jgi:hypothetical protein